MSEVRKTAENVFIGKDVLNHFNQAEEFSFSNWIVLVDENTFKHCYPLLVNYIPQHNTIQIASGEENKNLKTCEFIWEQLTNYGADRGAVLLNLGGGVIGDMGGFAASCYKRGIAFINVPTTLLAMVDASVGAKTGVDFMGLKNQLGVFNEPQAVFIHSTFLNTLPQRQLVSGFAEVIKHALIADKTLFEEVEGNPVALAEHNWEPIIKRNVRIKNEIVNADPYEKGARKALNFGHTIGHAVESYFLKSTNKLLHGEAIAVGIVCESFIAMKQEGLTGNELDKIRKLVLRYFSLPIIPLEHKQKLLDFIKQDKKNVKYQNRFTLLNGIGNYSIDNFVEDELVIDSLKYFNSFIG